MDDLIGQQIDNYRVESLLGEGGMGTVYRAHDLNLNRRVALKVMHAHLARRQPFQERFLQEAQSAARLEHPSIVAIYQFALHQQRNLLFMVMAYIPGGSLGRHVQHLQQTGALLPLVESLTITAQIADALDYAHQRQVIHRDIKPDNVMLKRLDDPAGPPFRAVVTDFGLAKIAEGGLQTASGAFLGTMAYMSPEQVLGRHLDGRSDIYSLGIVLYELVTGRLPFDVRTPTEAVQLHTRSPLPPPRTVQPNLPEAVEAIIMKATAKKAADCYERAGEMAAALRQAAAQLPQQDATQLVARQSSVSLKTLLVDEVPGPIPSLPGIAPLSKTDQLIITRRDQRPQTLPLDRPSITIGRSSDNDVVLDDPGVSRNHVRLERMGDEWGVVDLKSSNGTFLNQSRLLPHLAQRWDAGQSLGIGPFFLFWQPGGVKSVIPPDDTQMFGAGLGVQVKPLSVSITPGQRADVQVELFNRGSTVDHYRIEVEGLPAGWLTVPAHDIHLMPANFSNSNASLTLDLHPPPGVQTVAKTYNYRIKAILEPTGLLAATVSGQVIIEPIADFTSRLSPTLLPSGATSRLLIRNEGNRVDNYRIAGHDPAEAITFKFSPKPVRLGPGQEETIDLTVAVKQRPWLGRETQLPFTVQISSGKNEGRAETHAGQLQVKPILPPWIVPLFGALLLLVCGLSWFAWDRTQQSTAQATQTAVAGLAVVIAAQTTDAQATAEAGLAVASQGTFAAQTAVAEGDDDQDGLSNLEEQTRGTLPQDPDTDDDGLSDGEEIRIHGTDPNDNDSDNDTLLDGAEIQNGTSPENNDTDDDSIPDGLDPQPLATDPPVAPTEEPASGAETPDTAQSPAPTETPTATSTPTPTETPTLTPTSTETPPPTPTFEIDGTFQITTLVAPPLGTINPGVLINPQFLLPLSNISCTDSPPVIDGVFSADEWPVEPFVEFQPAGNRARAVKVYFVRDAARLYLAFVTIDNAGSPEATVRVLFDTTNNGDDPDTTDRWFEVTGNGTASVYAGIGTNGDGKNWDTNYTSTNWVAAVGAPVSNESTVEIQIDAAAEMGALSDPFAMMAFARFIFGDDPATWPETAVEHQPDVWQDVGNASCP